MLNLVPTPAASSLPASSSATGSSTAARGKDPSAAVGAFDNMLSQLTGRSTERPRGKGGDAGAPPANPQAQAASLFAADPFAALRQPPVAVATPARPSGLPAVADAPIAQASAPSVDDQQAIANSLMWMLASAGMTKVEAMPVGEGGASADAHGAPQGTVDGPIGAAAVAAPGVNAVANAISARIQKAMAAAGDRPGVERDAAPAGAGEVARQRPTLTSSDGAVDTPSSGRVPAPPAAGQEAQMAALATAVAGDQVGATAAASPANNAGATGPALGAVAATSTVNAGAARRAANVVSGSPAINVNTAGPAAGAPAQPEAPASPASGLPVAPKALAGIRAVDQPPAARSAPPATTFTAVPVAESRPADTRGSTTKDGRSSDEAFVEASIPRPAAALQSAGGFQVPMEMRAVGGVSTNTSVAEVGAPQSLSAGQDAADLPNQIVQAIRLQWADGVGDARITLKPEYLGELSIAIRVDRGAVSATLESAVPAVREWIDSHSSILREGLAAHGLELERLTTTEQAAPERKRDEQSEPRQQQHEHPRQQQQQQRRRGTLDAPAFEVIA